MIMEYKLEDIFDLQMGKRLRETILNIGIQKIINGFLLGIFHGAGNTSKIQRNISQIKLLKRVGSVSFQQVQW